MAEKWLHSVAKTGNYNELENKPSSLPANGGNSATADKLKTARRINGVSFDGTQDITINTNGGRAATADKLTTPRRINGVEFDGSADITIGSVGGGEASSVTWNNVQNKPSTFPPSAHTHSPSQVIEDTSHRFVSDVEKSKWNGKAEASHTHKNESFSQINEIGFGAKIGNNDVNKVTTIGGNDSANISQLSNINIGSWNGVSFFPTSNAGSVQPNKPAVTVNCREGNIELAGKVTAYKGVNLRESITIYTAQNHGDQSKSCAMWYDTTDANIKKLRLDTADQLVGNGFWARGNVEANAHIISNNDVMAKKSVNVYSYPGYGADTSKYCQIWYDTRDDKRKKLLLDHTDEVHANNMCVNHSFWSKTTKGKWSYLGARDNSTNEGAWAFADSSGKFWDIYARQLVTQSDERCKDIIDEDPRNNTNKVFKAVKFALDDVRAITPKKFIYCSENSVKAEGKVRYGFIAQEVENIIPEAVFTSTYTDEEIAEGMCPTDKNGNPIKDSKGVETTALIATLWKATQELATENENLSSEMTSMRIELEELKNQVKQLIK